MTRGRLCCVRWFAIGRPSPLRLSSLSPAFGASGGRPFLIFPFPSNERRIRRHRYALSAETGGRPGRPHDTDAFVQEERVAGVRGTDRVRGLLPRPDVPSRQGDLRARPGRGGRQLRGRGPEPRARVLLRLPGPRALRREAQEGREPGGGSRGGRAAAGGLRPPHRRRGGRPAAPPHLPLGARERGGLLRSLAAQSPLPDQEEPGDRPRSGERAQPGRAQSGHRSRIRALRPAHHGRRSMGLRGAADRRACHRLAQRLRSLPSGALQDRSPHRVDRLDHASLRVGDPGGPRHLLPRHRPDPPRALSRDGAAGGSGLRLRQRERQPRPRAAPSRAGGRRLGSRRVVRRLGARPRALGRGFLRASEPRARAPAADLRRRGPRSNALDGRGRSRRPPRLRDGARPAAAHVVDPPAEPRAGGQRQEALLAVVAGCAAGVVALLRFAAHAPERHSTFSGDCLEEGGPGAAAARGIPRALGRALHGRCARSPLSRGVSRPLGGRRRAQRGRALRPDGRSRARRGAGDDRRALPRVALGRSGALAGAPRGARAAGRVAGRRVDRAGRGDPSPRAGDCAQGFWRAWSRTPRPSARRPRSGS